MWFASGLDLMEMWILLFGFGLCLDLDLGIGLNWMERGEMDGGCDNNETIH